ncbi:MAG: hypothetical protein E7459_02235 [Ruminococcaceae bacterium]|nr:hypothetical protein [Oscillospiraceae bacterium]
MIRWMGAIIVIVACGCCGCSMARSYGELEHSLRQLLSAMELMHCQMEYRLTTLPELCRILPSACSGIVGKVFSDLGQELERQETMDISLCMEEALQKNPKLPVPCARSLRRLSRILGQADLQLQLRGITTEMERMKVDLRQVAAERPGRVKSYRALGICGGIALAIVLL